MSSKTNAVALPIGPGSNGAAQGKRNLSRASAAVEIDGGEIVIRIRNDAAPADALIAIAAEPLAEHGLELKSVLRLIDDGKLRVVEIGRRRFTKLSYLLALVDTLPATTSPTPETLEDDLTIAARKRAMRRAS